MVVFEYKEDLGVQLGSAMRKRVWAYADKEDPDQPAYPYSLIRAFTVC